MSRKRESKKVVSSKIEITTPPTESTEKRVATKVDGRSLSLREYHLSIDKMGKEIERFALSLCKENLLSVKMALMQAVRGVEDRMRERKE